MSDRAEALKWRMRAEKLEVVLERVVNEADFDDGVRPADWRYIITYELYQAAAKALA